MALKYDYDIHWNTPRAGQADPEIGGVLDEIAAAQDPRATFVALFRDPATAEALAGADPQVLAFFEQSGFGLNSYDSGAPDGCFPAEDLRARNDVTERLTANLSQFDLFGKNTNGFDFTAFLTYEMTAEPIEMAALADQPLAAATSKGPSILTRIDARLRQRFPSISPLAVGLAVLLFFLMPSGVAQF
jgi:hypothetical protein